MHTMTIAQRQKQLAKLDKLKKKPLSPLEGANGQLMVMAAHRYCLGRQSYIVGAAIEWLTLHWPEFEAGTKQIILRDTISALMDKVTGSDTDHREWLKFAQTHWPEIGSDSQQAIKSGLAYKQQPWPWKE